METEKTQLPEDDFSRDVIAEKLVKVILSENNISPVLINGDWGTGKTVLANRIRNKLIEHPEKSTCVYINAFQEDHSENALITLVAAVASILPEKKERKLIEAAKPALRLAVKTGAKAFVSHVTRQDADKLGEDLSKALSEIANATIDSTIEAMIKDHVESEKNILSLKNMLVELSKDKKIIIIIDELDRCNPYFAIDLIEKIKYVFDMDNIKFILIANRNQLESSINNKYGGSNSQSYLEKFIRLSIELPVNMQDNDKSYNASSIYFNKLVKKSLAFSHIHKQVISELSDIITANSISLREVEYFIRNIEIYDTLTDGSLSNNPLPIVGAYKLLFIFIYSFSNKFNISEKELKNNPSIIMNISGLKYISNSKLNLLSLIASTIAYLVYDEDRFSYKAENDNEYNTNLQKQITARNPNNFSDMINYNNKLFSTFNTLSFF